MKYLLPALFAAAAGVGVAIVNAQPPPQQPSSRQLTPLMQMKLERSKLVLEGLALEDYEKIAANAKALGLLSLESGWQVIQTAEYERQSDAFRRAAGVIADAVGEQDISRATLGYVDLTMRCVECHSYMRKHRKQ